MPKKQYKYTVECKDCGKTKTVERPGATPKRFLTPPTWQYIRDLIGLGAHLCPDCIEYNND